MAANVYVEDLPYKCEGDKSAESPVFTRCLGGLCLTVMYMIKF
jgi:hypothetical protein